MAVVKHYNKKAMGRVIKEAFRELNSYKNNVDPNRSSKNYHYGKSDNAKDMQTAVQNRVNEIMEGRNVQDKTNIISSWVVSLPKLFEKEKSKEFFDTVYEFCVNRYGEKNVIDGIVHMDEDNPHIHIFLVPEATSRKTSLNTVSSASKFTRTELAKFHTDLDKFCEQRFNQSKLVRNGKTVQNGLELDDFKRVTQMTDGFTDFLKNKIVDTKNKRSAQDYLDLWLAEYNKSLQVSQNAQKAQNDDLQVKASKSKPEPVKTVSEPSESSQKAPEAVQRATVDIVNDEKRNLSSEELLEDIKRDKKTVVKKPSEVTKKCDSLGKSNSMSSWEQQIKSQAEQLNKGEGEFRFAKPDQTPLGQHSK